MPDIELFGVAEENGVAEPDGEVPVPQAGDQDASPGVAPGRITINITEPRTGR